MAGVFRGEEEHPGIREATIARKLLAETNRIALPLPPIEHCRAELELVSESLGGLCAEKCIVGCEHHKTAEAIRMREDAGRTRMPRDARYRPLTAVTGVRIPYGTPFRNKTANAKQGRRG